MKRFLTLSLILVGVLVHTAHAQRSTFWAANAVLAVPTGSFGTHNTIPALGGSAFAGMSVSRLPLIIGIEGTLVSFGFTPEVAFAGSNPIQPGAWNLTRHRIAATHAIARIHQYQHVIGPYAEVLLGAKYFVSETSVRLDNPSSYDYFPVADRRIDVAFSYGAGAGLDIRPFGGGAGWIQIHLGARYLLGSKATYLAHGSLEYTGDRIQTQEFTSRTNMLMLDVGISLKY